MPLLAIPRYNYGYQQPISPGVLSPPVDDPDSPAFDPSMASLAQSQQQSPLPPPPQMQPPPAQLNDTSQSSQIANPPPLIPLNGGQPAGGSARDTGVKKLLASNAMPPPQPPGQTQAQPQASAVAPALEPQAAEPTTADVNAGTPPPSSAPTAIDKQVQDLAQESKDLKKPDAANSNWLQRLSGALLAFTRFAPYSNQIVHPKWSQEEKAYESKQADIDQRIKTLGGAESAEANAENRRAWAATRRGQEMLNEEKAADFAAKPGQVADEHQRKVSEDAAKFYIEQTGQIQKGGGQILPDGMAAPPTYTQIPIKNPSTGAAELWIQPPMLSSLKDEDPATANEMVKRGRMTPEEASQLLIPSARKSYRDTLDKILEGEAAKTPVNVPVDQRFVNEYIADPKHAHPDGSTATVEDALRAHAAIQAPDQGTWELAEDGEGKPVEHNTKTGAIRPVSGIQKTGTAAKNAADEEKRVGPARDALNYAQDYLTNGTFTGSGDEALQEKFFELAKPTTGFRMTQPQIDMLQNSRSWMGSAEAHIRHAATGRWFSDEQRQQIVNTMMALAAAKGLNHQPGQQPNSPTNAAPVALPRVSNADEYNKLAPGAAYLDPDGNHRTKPIPQTGGR